MSSIILSALWGVLMMFSGIFLKKKSLAKYIALLGMFALLTVNFLEYYNIWFIHANIGEMLKFSAFGQIFNAIVFSCTLLFFLLNGEEFETIGNDVYEYYALIFFCIVRGRAGGFI